MRVIEEVERNDTATCSFISSPFASQCPILTYSSSSDPRGDDRSLQEPFVEEISSASRSEGQVEWCSILDRETRTVSSTELQFPCILILFFAE